jgi:hypothetical protein
MALTDRDLRKLANTKQGSIEFQGKPSAHGMLDGQLAIEKQSNSQLALYRKKYGKLWKSYMSSNGDQYVDKTLTTNTLKYTNKFIDYRFIAHNFTADIGTTETYIPWYGVSDSTGMNGVSSAFLAPYKMTLHKLFVRPETISNTSAELTFALDKQDDGDTTVDSIATFTYDTTLASNTLLTVNRSDWSANPSVEAGDKIGLSIDANTDPSGNINWYITSVWRIEIVI